MTPMFHGKRPGAAASLALVAVLAAGCTLLLVQPACLVACEAATADAAASGAASASAGGASR